MTFSFGSLSKLIQQKTNHAAAGLQQKSTSSSIGNRALSVLAAPTSFLGTTTSAFLAAADALTRPNEAAISFAHITAVAKRILTSYPYKSINKLYDLLLNESLKEAQMVRETALGREGLLDITCSLEFAEALHRIEKKITDLKLDFFLLIQEDIQFAIKANHSTEAREMLRRLSSNIRNDHFIILRELLSASIGYLINHHKGENPSDIVIYAISQYLLEPSLRTYISYIESSIREIIVKTANDERSMRVLGSNDPLYGKSLLVNEKASVMHFIAIYFVIGEIEENPYLKLCPELRKQKLLESKELLNKFLKGKKLSSDDFGDGRLYLTRDIYQSAKGSNLLFDIINELSKELVSGELMKIQIFSVDATAPISISDRFHAAWKRGIKEIN